MAIDVGREGCSVNSGSGKAQVKAGQLDSNGIAPAGANPDRSLFADYVPGFDLLPLVKEGSFYPSAHEVDLTPQNQVSCFIQTQAVLYPATHLHLSVNLDPILPVDISTLWNVRYCWFPLRSEPPSLAFSIKADRLESGLFGRILCPWGACE